MDLERMLDHAKVSLVIAVTVSCISTSAAQVSKLQFKLVASTRTDLDDYFTHAVLRISNEHKSLIARNYIVADSEQIRWLDRHPDRIGARLFRVGQHGKPTRLPDSTHFGFIPNRPLAYAVVGCDAVRFWNTETHEKLTITFPHALPEGRGPHPAVSPDGNIMVTQANDTLYFWDLQTLKPLVPETEQAAWNFKLAFSSDGKWLFSQTGSRLKIWNPKIGKIVAGPFPHDLIHERFAYTSKSQRLATFQNNDEGETDWSSRVTIRSGPEWQKTLHVDFCAHAREAIWLGEDNLLIIADQKAPRRRPPYPYGRKLIYLLAVRGNALKIKDLHKAPWILSATVGSDDEHFLIATRDETSCWKLGTMNPLWSRTDKHTVFAGDGNWVLFHRGERAVIYSLETGEELWSKDDVQAARVEGSRIWLCLEGSYEVWEVQK